MSDLRQMPLLPDQPTKPEDIHRTTPLAATVELFQKYLQKEGKSEHTIKAFTSDLLLVAEYTDGGTPIGQYTTTILNEFLHWLEFGRGIPCSRKSYARRVTTIKVYFKWLHTIGALPHDPAKAVLQRSGPAPLSHVLGPEQIKDAINIAGQMKRGNEIDTRPEMLFRLLLDTGIKKSETTRLVPDDIDRSNPNRPMVIIKHKVRNVYKERRIALDPDWLSLFDAYSAQYPPGKKQTIITCTSRNLEYILTAIGEEADIPFKLSFEVMRWTCAVRDYLSGAEEAFIQDKLGLSDTSWYETGRKIKMLAERVRNEARH